MQGARTGERRDPVYAHDEDVHRKPSLHIPQAHPPRAHHLRAVPLDVSDHEIGDDVRRPESSGNNVQRGLVARSPQRKSEPQRNFDEVVQQHEHADTCPTRPSKRSWMHEEAPAVELAPVRRSPRPIAILDRIVLFVNRDGTTSGQCYGLFVCLLQATQRLVQRVPIAHAHGLMVETRGARFRLSSALGVLPPVRMPTRGPRRRHRHVGSGVPFSDPTRHASGKLVLRWRVGSLFQGASELVAPGAV
mmetsp:Transcript_111621/g.315222  ORF Transcript_111621/g.315222 Transcript_111621/m.315222 type:complete len:247 (-) Transcript_111621:275-1015(-)